MYTTHYNLNIKPFQISSDAEFIWLGEKHKEALATLRYGILDNKGFLLLTGDVGTGKTTLINALIASLSDDVIYASVPDPSLDRMDFFNYIAAAFDISGEFESKGKFLASFSKFLHKAYDNHKKVLLIIDESQLMTQELLEEIRLLSNIVTKDSSPLLNIFFVGQYEFNEIIRRPENRAVAQRLTLNYYIEPLTLEETGKYIRHRLEVAGTIEQIFNASAVKAIYDFSEGFPRKINVICDHCLMSGYAEDKKIITSAIVKESAEDLQVPERRRTLKQERPAAPRQPYTMMPVTPAPEEPHARLAETHQPPDKMKQKTFPWLTGLLLSILVLISLGFVFLYFSNTTYKEAVAYVGSLHDKVGQSAFELTAKNNKPESKGEKDQKVFPENTSKTTDTPTPSDVPRVVKEPIIAEKSEEAIAPDTVTSGETNYPYEEKSKITERDIEPVKHGPVAAQPVLEPQSMISDSADKAPDKMSSPLPKEPLVIRFKNDSNLFSIADIERMKELVMILQKHPEATVNIIGYTDSIGDEGYNRKLSEFRANMVKSFLLGQNLPPGNITTQGLGKENPVGRNDTAEGRTLNRRVEISVDTGM
jgi:general secretion pathway protein A